MPKKTSTPEGETATVSRPRVRRPSKKKLQEALQASIVGHVTEEQLAVIERGLTPNRREAQQLESLGSLRTADPYDRERAWVSDALIFCPLPFKRLKERQVINTARLNASEEMEVIYTATGKADLPFGNDAFLLDLLVSEARKRGTPEVTFKSLREILAILGRADGSKDYREIRERVDRLSGLHIRLERKGHVRLNIRVIDVENLEHYDPKAEATGQQPLLQYVFRFAQEFYQDLTSYYTVIPIEVLKAFAGSPVEYSLARWIYRRVINARSSALVPWKELQEERGSKDSHERRFRMNVRRVVAKLKAAWPELADAIADDPKGIRILRRSPSLIPDRPTPPKEVHLIGDDDEGVG